MLHILFNVYRFYAYITCQAKLDMHIHNHSLRRRAFQKSPTMWIWIRTCGCVRASVLLPDISNIDFEIEFDELFPGSVTNERFPQPFRATATFFFFTNLPFSWLFRLWHQYILSLSTCRSGRQCKSYRAPYHRTHCMSLRFPVTRMSRAKIGCSATRIKYPLNLLLFNRYGYERI